MGMNINNWMDDWFLSLSENHEKLKDTIESYQFARLIGFTSVMIIGAVVVVMTFTSDKDYNSLLVPMILLLVISSHADIYIKVLKLLRTQQTDGRGTESAT